MNEKIQTNEMGRKTVSVLLVKIGLPMVLSMILQSIYNIVDTAFVINMGEDGAAGNLALTYSFPIQILIIALGVGTGIGINALLSKNLGEGNLKKVNAIVGNGIFLGICMYVIFLLFGIFFAEPFIAMQSGGNEKATMMGTEYLRICCVFSVGAVGFTVYERFLPSNGKVFVFDYCPDCGSRRQYRARLRFYLSLEYGNRRGGMGYRYRSDNFFDFSYGVPLRAEQRDKERLKVPASESGNNKSDI